MSELNTPVSVGLSWLRSQAQWFRDRYDLLGRVYSVVAGLKRHRGRYGQLLTLQHPQLPVSARTAP